MRAGGTQAHLGDPRPRLMKVLCEWTRERFKDQPDDFFIKPTAIADELWHVAHQDRSAWSFLVELVASLVTTNRVLLDSSVFSHVTPAPAAGPDWRAGAALSALGLLGVAIGIAGFRRRDLAGA